MEHYYRFAGIELSVVIPDEKCYEDESRLKAFAVDAVTSPHNYTVEMVDVLEEPKGSCIASYPNFRVYEDEGNRVRYIGNIAETLEGAYLRVENCEKNHRIQVLNTAYPERITTKPILKSMEVEHLLAENQGFILHCSYVEIGGEALLFTAPSGTGKSTQAELWKELRGAQIVNGDRAAVRLVDGGIVAEGVPFSGSSTYCLNRSLPIAAIVYLGQAPKTAIQKLEGSFAFRKLWEGISVNAWDEQDTEKISRVASEVVRRVPLFHLSCTPDESAICALEKVLIEKR